MILFERLEDLSDVTFAAQFYLAEGPRFDIRGSVSRRLRYQHHSSEHFVGRLKPRCRIDSVAVRRVVEPRRAAEVSDNGTAGIDADAGHPESQTLPRLQGNESVREPMHLECRREGAGRMVGLGERRVEHHMNGVADYLVD